MNQNVLNDVIKIIKFYGFKQYDGKIYGFLRTPRTSEVGRLKAIDEDLSESDMVITINRGKGPGEAPSCNDFVKVDDRWYVFDAFMLRFNCYDSNGEFIDTYNLNTAIQLKITFAHAGELYGISIKPGEMILYELEIEDKEVILTYINSIKLDKSYHLLYSVVYSDDDQMLIFVGNTLYLIETNGNVTFKKIKLLGKKDTYYPVIINRNEKSFIYLFANKYYKYDYEKNKITRVDEPDYEGTIVINGKKWVIKKEDDRLVKYLEN